MNLKSSEPFWLVKNGILNSYPSLSREIETDILIIGGGITGSLIAHQCMEDGYKTVLVDKREIANGSTSATTSMLQYEIDTPLYKLIEQIGEKGAVDSYRACYQAIDKLGEIAHHIKSDCGYKKKDSLYFAARKKDVSWLKREFEARKKYGFPVSWLEAKDIRQKYHLSNTYGGILSRQGGSMDAFCFTHDLLAYNRKRGLLIYDKTNIEKVKYHKGSIQAQTEYGNSIKAKKVIYCNGYESVEIIKDRFVNLLSTFAIVGERYEGDQTYLKDILIWNTARPYIYMRTTDDNRILIGGEDEKFVNTTKRDRLLLKKQLKLEKHLENILPEHDFRTDFVWAGTFGETKDGLPYIGTHPDFPAAYFVLGFGGNGITFSVTGMSMVSNMLKGEIHPLTEYFKFRR
ncbi:FAD-dependent oxidoreductase [Arachidicoccus ginsenosidivorans]|jgi:glycine/D-amino acid oxidase-like deaminating enzyme|uniref:FAD-binding oxidoreductase n=1 Tax=Arachidicoccus ginsenosidivorans TaxID=496057 RepID=A0A5B8VVB2_9BACT|nr:FAD-binding oxidoreductase [Arachidicoccus ginsenosidivorans]QEC74118.1 FAD-binding oxidoreductase [Arachidicoccus ginsenosidivorans]